MGVEEISSGPKRERRPWGWALVAAVVALGVVLVVTLQRGGSRRTPVAPTPAPSGGVRSAPESTPAPRARSVLTAVDVGSVCPAVTDGRTALDVAFTLVNVSDVPVDVLEVDPLLPLQGLQTLSTSVRGGICGRPDPTPAVGPLQPGEALLVIFRFGLPSACPQPLPVQARVRVRAASQVLTGELAVYADLGAVDFDACGSTPRP